MVQGYVRADTPVHRGVASLDRPAKLAGFFFLLSIPLGLIGLASDLMDIVAPGSMDSLMETNTGLAVVSAIVLLYLIAYLGAVIAFHIWLYRAVSNLWAFSRTRPRFSPAVSVWGSLLPLVQFGGWFFVLDALAARSRSDDTPLAKWSSYKSVSREVTLWYYLFSAGCLAMIWTLRPRYWEPENPAIALEGFAIGLVGEAFIAGAAFAGIAMMRRINADQQARLATSAPSGPTD